MECNGHVSHLELLLKAHLLIPDTVIEYRGPWIIGLALADSLLENKEPAEGAGALILIMGAIAEKLTDPTEQHPAEHFRLAETMLLECAAACRAAHEQLTQENHHGS